MMTSFSNTSEKAKIGKVALKPGFGLANWCQLNDSLLVNKSKVIPVITKEELQQHNSVSDCWVSYNGKVYNITQYLDYHPGGVDILLESAGKDCTLMVNKYHKWVNVDGMLSAFHVGNYLSGDEEVKDIVETVPDELPVTISKCVSDEALRLLNMEDSDDES